VINPLDRSSWLLQILLLTEEIIFRRIILNLLLSYSDDRTTEFLTLGINLYRLC